MLRFTIETDPNQPPVPNVDVRGEKAEWPGTYYRLDGMTCKKVIALTCPDKAAFACREEYRSFVALIGLREDVVSSASVVFEVFAGERKIYSSRPMTKYASPVGIDVRIPPKTKEVRLVTTGTDFGGRHWACWVDAGFVLRADPPRVGHVILPVPGYDPSEYEVMVSTFNGIRVPAKRLQTSDEGRIELLFFGGHGALMYHAYVVPKNKYEPPPKDWEPDAGLVLETRRVAKSRQRECEDLAGLRKVWDGAGETVGHSLVPSLHHGYPVHPRLIDPSDQAVKDSLALYRYTGFFEADRAGEYVFATASNWGSHLLIDGKLVVSWPGNHDYREGITGQKQGRIALEPGVHKLDYLNYSPWGTMFTLAAWQPPGGKLALMTRSDFPSVRDYVPAVVESNPSVERKTIFTWDVVDDWRLDRDKPALVRMRFQAVPDRGMQDAGQSAQDKERRLQTQIRWTFEDGTVRTGPAVEHVFLSPGKHTVGVQILRGDQVIAQAAQTVRAGARADKIWVEPRDPEPFKRGMSQIDLHKLPIRDVANLYVFSNETHESDWKNLTIQVLLERATELMAQREYWTLCLELGRHLGSAAVQQYDRALSIYSGLQDRTPEGSPIRQQTMVLAGELLLRCLGKPDAALRLLNQARWVKAQGGTWAIRLGLARAEALIVLGETKELALQMQQLQELRGQQDQQRQSIKHAALLREARSIADLNRGAFARPTATDPQTNDPSQLDRARENLETILHENPGELLSPGLNQVRLDVHLASGEYKIARYLAERLARLEMTPYDRAQVLLRHVKALCAMGDVETAKKALEDLNQVYPASKETSEARAVVVETMKRARTQ